MSSHPDQTGACPASAAPLVRTRGGRRTLEFAPGDIQSEMLLSDPDALVLDYTRAMMCFALFAPRPRHILMIGLGGGSLVKFCHRHFPDCRITVIEVRADVIALRDQFRIPPDGARLRIVHADAAACLAALAGGREGARSGCPHAGIGPADAILVDGFDRAGLPAALANEGFYRDCRALLRDGGVLVANVFTYDARHDAVLAALDSVFGGRTCWLDKVAGNNRIVFAVCARDDAAPAARLQRRLARWRAIGPGWLNRLGVGLLLAWLGRRSIARPRAAAPRI